MFKRHFFNRGRDFDEAGDFLGQAARCARGEGRGRHGHSHHGRDSGEGFGFGGRMGFGRGGGGGRVFGAGDLRLVLLALIAEAPRHGYELIKEIEQRFGGAYAPSPGSVYPTLILLEELGQIRGRAEDGSKKLFEITDEGRAHLAANRAAADGAMNRMAMVARMMGGGRPPEAVHQAMHTLKTALMFRRGGWSEAETARVSAIIERAAQEISGGGSEEA
ncbi:PadR family transcriptional regulator [Solimonas soli]|uniref:PadR family transcriptional regulator n=1 Tax=Solimonas soli TaxID=413479 RepID=UPI0004B6CCF9|nr:PadR family transcriptional regulator [Solimonas soli]